jgi:hypothetical protein
MAQQAEQTGGPTSVPYNLDDAFQRVRTAEANVDKVRLDEANDLAEELVATHEGQATLREMVFAIHGFDLSEWPRNAAEEQIKHTYETVKGKFLSVSEGEPMALVGQPTPRYGVSQNRQSPLWVGRAVGFECHVFGEEDRLTRNSVSYRGSMVMKVADVWVPAWDASRAEGLRPPTFSDEKATMTHEPEIRAQLVQAIRTDNLPGTAKGLDGEIGNYAMGWSDIISRSMDVQAGDAAAQLLLHRIAEVMTDYSRPQES